MPQETKSKHDVSAPERLEGWRIEASDTAAFDRAVELAFDYRGDVTLRLKDGEAIEGYVYDRRRGADFGQSVLRIMPKNDESRRTVRYADIAAIEFSGRDTAAGKSFETWMKKYVRKKLAGEDASIESEPLTDE